MYEPVHEISKNCGVLTCVDSDEPLQSPFKLRNSKMTFGQHRILKRLAKALIRLRVCAGWSEALLVAHTTLLEVSCWLISSVLIAGSQLPLKRTYLIFLV